MNFIRKYPQKWLKFTQINSTPQPQPKHTQINKSKINNLIFKELIENDIQMSENIFSDLFKEKYKEKYISTTATVDCAKLETVMIMEENVRDICGMLYEDGLFHFIDMILEFFVKDIRFSNVCIAFDIATKYRRNSEYYRTLYGFIISHSFVLMKRYMIPNVSLSVLTALLSNSETAIYFHSEEMIAEMVFEFYRIQPCPQGSYHSYSTLLKPLLQYVNWGTLNIDKLHLIHSYISIDILRELCKTDILELSSKPIQHFRNRKYIGIPSMLPYDTFRITYDLTELDHTLEISTCLEHPMYYITVLQSDKDSINTLTSLLPMKYLFKYSTSLTLKESLILSHFIKKYPTFQQLTYLSIWDSDFRGSVAPYICEILTNLPYLEALNLFNIISTNEILNQLLEILSTKKLRSLWMRKCRMSDENCLYFIELFQNSSILESIYFSDNHLTELSLYELINFLHHQPRLVDFGLSGNHISDSVVCTLTMTLPFWVNLKSLYLRNLFNTIHKDCALVLFSSITSNCKRLKNIDLSYNKMTDEEAFILGGLFGQGTFVDIILSNCELTDIQIIGMFTKLEENKSLSSLRIDNNNLSDISAAKLSEKLPYLHSLTRLFVYANKFTDVGITLLAQSLRTPHLSFLRTQDNIFTDRGLETYSREIGKMSKIRECYLGDKAIQRGGQPFAVETQVGLGHFTSHIFMFRLLLCLTIENIPITSDPLIQSLGELIRNNIHLKNITFKGLFQQNSLQPIFQSFKFTPELNELILCNNKMNDDNYECLINNLVSCHELLYLTLTNNDITDEGFKNCIDSFKTLSTLQLLYFDKNHLSDQSAQYLAECMSTSFHNLTHLNLGNNRITAKGASDLGDGINAIKDVFSVFSISNNPIRDAGLSGLCKGLYNCPELKEFLVGQCEISEEGCLALCCVLRHGNRDKLTRLQLNLNQIGEKGALGLGLSVANIKNLESFGVMYNQIPFNGLKYLTEQLSLHCSVLNTVYLSYNPLLTTEKEIIKTLFKDHIPATFDV